MTIQQPLLPRARGLIGVRADGSNAQTILEELQRTFATFKQEHEEELKGLKAKFADVVQTEKVDRINNEITNLTNALDEVNQALAAVRTGGGGGDPLDPQAKEHAQAFDKFFRKGIENGLHDLEVKAQLTTQSDPDGGYTVPVETESTIDRVLGTVSAMRSLARVMTISAGKYKKMVNMGGTSSGWVDEEEERDETKTPQLRLLEFPVMEIFAEPHATQALLDDSQVDIAGWLADEVAIEFAEQEGAAFISGSGKSKPRGILSYDTVVNSNYSWGKIGHIKTGKAAGFADTDPADALIDLYYALKSGYRNGASWLMCDEVMGKVRKMKDGDGNYLWAPPTEKGEVATILQKPVVTDDNMHQLGAGKLPIAFGNFQRGYLIIDRIGIRVLRDPLTQKPYIKFYTTKRVGGGVQNFEAIKLLKCAA